MLLQVLCTNGIAWGFQVPALTDAGFRVIAPDARGFGASTYPGKSSNIVDMAIDMIQLIERLEIHSLHLVGISMGGTFALQLAWDHPS